MFCITIHRPVVTSIRLSIMSPQHNCKKNPRFSLQIQVRASKDTISQIFVPFSGTAVVGHSVSSFERLGVCLPICLSTSVSVCGRRLVYYLDHIHSHNQQRPWRPRTIGFWENQRYDPGSNPRLAFVLIERRNLVKILPIVPSSPLPRRPCSDPLPSADKVTTRRVPRWKKKAVTHCSPRRREGCAEEVHGHRQPLTHNGGWVW